MSEVGAAAGVRLYFKLAKSWYPLPPSYESAGPPLAELKQTYRKWDFLELPLYFLLIAGLTYAWSQLLMPLQAWNASRYEPAAFHLYPPPMAMVVPAIFLGILCSFPFAYVTYYALLRKRFALYERYCNLKRGFDHRRATRQFLWFYSFLCAAMVLGIVNWHTVFDERGIRFQSWFGLERSTYPYDAVRDIRTSAQFQAPNGNLVQRREWIIEFADGAKWKTSFNMFELTEAKKDAIAKFVSQRSCKPVRELTLLE